MIELKTESGKINKKSLKEYIWYACYGPDINEEYFKEKILQCSDASLPLESKPFLVNYPLFFAPNSKSCNEQGIACLDDTKIGYTYGKIYKITKAQFDSIKKINADELKEIELGKLEGIPVYTTTCINRREIAMPSLLYFSKILIGLKEIYPEYSEFYLGNNLVNSILSRSEIKILAVLRKSKHGLTNEDIIQRTGLTYFEEVACIKRLSLLKLIKQDTRSLAYAFDDLEAVFFTLKKERNLIDEILRLIHEILTKDDFL